MIPNFPHDNSIDQVDYIIISKEFGTTRTSKLSLQERVYGANSH